MSMWLTRMSHYRECPPGGALIQSNRMREGTTKKCEDTAKYSITGIIRYKNKTKNKPKICINRHIIKYYVITEHVLVHGDWFWRVRDAPSDLEAFAPLIVWPLMVSHSSRFFFFFLFFFLWHGHHPHIRTVHPNNWTAVSKETRAKNIKLLYQSKRERERERARERERESEWKRAAREKWLAESLVYPPSFYTLCCQCLTGSWLSRPNCFYPLYLSAHTRSYQRVCTCVCRYDVIWLSCFRGVNSLPPTRLFFFLIFLFIYFLTSPSFPGLCRAPW